jgi:hypothetical protein
MIETIKIMEGVTRCNKSTWFDMQKEEDYEVRRTRTNMRINDEGDPETRENVIKGGRSRTNLSEWNGLPHIVKTASSVNSFKNSYDHLILKKQGDHQIPGAKELQRNQFSK